MKFKVITVAAVVGSLLSVGGWQASAQVDAVKKATDAAQHAANVAADGTVVGEAANGANTGSANTNHRRSRRSAPRPAPAPSANAATMETPLQNPDNFVDEAVGMYSDPSTAMQLSTFTVNKRMVSCAVGTLAAAQLNSTGPFAMLMYSTSISTYQADKAAGTLTATGRMRSITQMGNLGVNPPTEDVEHDFIAIAERGPGMKFATHFRTPFWNTGNPMCTPSSLVSGGCKFGGSVHMGTVNV